MILQFISYIPAIVGVMSIGIFVFLNARNLQNKFFALLNLFIALWLICLFVGGITDSQTVALWALRSGLFFAAIGFLLFFYFALLFPYKTKISIGKVAFYSLPIIVAAALSFTPYVAPGVRLDGGAMEPVGAGFLYAFTDIISIAYLVAGIALLLGKYKKADERQKKQIHFVLIGLIIALVVNIVTGEVISGLQVDSAYVDIGGFSLFIFSIFVAYAMIRHGFLDIRFIVARTFAYSLSLGSIAAIYSALVFGVLSQLMDFSRTSRGEQIVYVVVAVFLAFTFQPIKQFFDRLSNRIFFRNAYDPQQFLDDFNKLLVATYELHPLLHRSLATVQENLRPSFGVFAIWETSMVSKRVVTSSGTSPIGDTEIRSLRGALRGVGKKIIVADDLSGNHQALKELLSANNIAVLVRLTATASRSDEGVGFLALGAKKSGNQFNHQDMRVIEIIANELVIAIQNALHTEEIENFNATLQARITEATRKLRRTNEKLKALDEAKDDFVSMASHQLRTPLTSVKGYISMVLEGDAGKINTTQRKLLEQSFISSQRMVFLIADLLNVSRLKTGKFVIETSPVNLADVVQQEIGQLTEVAAGRQLALTYEKPDSFPSLTLDETKTRQVIMNFVDNAIYYTPAGGTITVKLIETPASVEFRVIDTGIGVPKHERQHLFTKFYRAANARTARPDGTGLGLFMAKKVIVAQGGAIIFETEEGKGSTFGFVFPKSLLAVKLPGGPDKA